MKNKKRSIYLLILSFMLVLSCTLFVVGCNKGNENTNPTTLNILDWGNVTITAEAGKMCELPVYEAKDKKGNTYKVMMYAYRKEDNARVPIVKNCIDIFSTAGYEVHYKAINGSASSIKKLTIKVSDMTPPSVICTGNKFAEVGVKYFWNGIAIKDNTDANIPYSVEVYDTNGMIVDYDSDGFTPTKLGNYDLKIRATDSFGNKGETTFRVYARTAKQGNEIERFNDEACVNFAYTLNGKIKNYGKYTTHKFSQNSNGSVCISSTSAANTNVYVSTRMTYNQMKKIADGILTASIYLAQKTDVIRAVEFCGKTFNIPTNTWVNLSVTEKDVGSFAVVLSRISNASDALFTIKNNEELFTLFIDKVVYTEAAPKVEGLKDSYTFGENVKFTVSSSYKAYLHTENEIKEVTTNFTLPKAGKYTLVFTTNDPLKSDYVHTFNYGSAALTFDSNVEWFGDSNNQLPKVYMNGEIVNNAKYYKVDIINGLKQEVTGVFSASNPFFLIAEVTISGRATFVKKFYDIINYAPGTLFDFDNESYSLNVTGVVSKYQEEFKGEKGCLVLEILANKNGLISGKKWSPVFNRVYYQNGGFTHLKIRMYVSNPAALDMTFYAADSNNMPIKEADYKLFASASNLNSEAGWFDVVLPIDGFIEYYNNFTTACNFWTTSKTDVTVAFASVTAVKM